MIEVSHLTKRYGAKYAVKDISFSVDEGEIVGFLGPNGAGKSTTMNILTGYLSSNEGVVKIGGYDILESPGEAKQHIGYLPEMPPLYNDMTVKEYLNFIYNIKRVKFNRRAHIEEICDLVKISDVSNRVIKNLSKGYRQRVGVAQALVGNPDVLILDEPTVGLDPKQIIEIRSLIKRLGKKHTVILSSHVLPEVQSVCERIIIINKGSIIADDSAYNLSRSFSGNNRIEVRIAGPQDAVLHALQGVKGVDSAKNLGAREEGSCDYEMEIKQDADVRRELFYLLAGHKWPILSLSTGEMTLEDIFLRLVNETGTVMLTKKPEITPAGGPSGTDTETQAQATTTSTAGSDADAEPGTAPDETTTSTIGSDADAEPDGQTNQDQGETGVNG